MKDLPNATVEAATSVKHSVKASMGQFEAKYWADDN